MPLPAVLVLGSPRSGTTWLGKIFDSHPEVFYLHEPDTLLRNDAFPHLAEAEESEAHREAAARYLAELSRVRQPKAAASTPVFAKAFRRPWQDRMRTALVHAVRASSAVSAKLRVPFALGVPDLVRRDRQPRALVIKSVSALGRAPLFLTAMPTLRLVHLVRHPCSQIASRLRGRALGVLDAQTFVRPFARTRCASSLGLSEANMAALPVEGQMACQWMIQNTMVHQALADDPRYRLVLYEDLCRAPESLTRELFDWCALPWSSQTETFLRASTVGGSERYFGVVRNSQAEIGKWRERLDARQIAIITDIAARSALGRAVLERAG